MTNQPDTPEPMPEAAGATDASSLPAPPTAEAASAPTSVAIEEPIATALPEATSTPEAPAAPASAPASKKQWYVVKVQSGREEAIKEAIERRVKIEGLEEYVGQIIIPVEKVIENRNGKRVERERKLYPGYLMVEVEYNDRILYLFRETSGVGDFVGGSLHHPPPPMPPHEVERMLGRIGEKTDKVVISKPKFDRGDRVKVRDGTFAGMEGEVKELLEAKGLVRVVLTIFGRPVDVELEYWQVEQS